jgi:hypothetical protein
MFVGFPSKVTRLLAMSWMTGVGKRYSTFSGFVNRIIGDNRPVMLLLITIEMSWDQ